MKSSLLLTIGLLLALGRSSLATGYGYKIYYGAQSSPAIGNNIAIWGQVGGGLGHDLGEAIWPTDPPPTGVLLGFYDIEGANGWDSATGWYNGTGRELVSTGRSVVIDNLYLWASAGTPSQSLQLRLGTSSWVPSQVTYKLSLISIPGAVSYVGQTQWGVSDTTITLPYYSATDGTTGYRFRVELAAVPEPSPLIALILGLCCIGKSRRGR